MKAKIRPARFRARTDQEGASLEELLPTRKFVASRLNESFKSIRWAFKGRVVNVIGNLVEGILPNTQVGTITEMHVAGRPDTLLAEVVGFGDNNIVRMLPYSHLSGVSPGCMITAVGSRHRIPVGDFLLGRVIDPFIEPLSGPPLAIPANPQTHPIDCYCPNPLERQRIKKHLGLGVRAIDGLLTFGQGQRIGIMAGSGVGKSVLMGMMAKNSDADINVIALIGERGREVREFIENNLGEEGLRKSVVVTVTSDKSALMRIRGAKVATAIAEHFSLKGKNVLLIVDSLTRVAMAQREIGNLIGEPPATKGYTPSVFSLLPALLERAGPQCIGRGAISGIYTVLVDGDDFNDPIADAARSILDGHINLSRSLASKGHYPAIDISTSISRVMPDIVDKDHWQLATQLKGLMGVFQENVDLIQIGAYVAGTNPALDLSLKLMPQIEGYLRQDQHEQTTFDSALTQLYGIIKNRKGG